MMGLLKEQKKVPLLRRLEMQSALVRYLLLRMIKHVPNQILYLAETYFQLMHLRLSK